MRIFSFLIIALMGMLSLEASAQRTIISREQAYKILLENKIVGNSKNEQWVYGSRGVLQANMAIPAFDRRLKAPEFNSWYFFTDDAPYANWQHDCRHIFVNTNTGAFKILDGRTPPDFLQELELLTKKTEVPRSVEKFFPNSISCGSSSNKYAVIISGGYNQGNNHIRYWNDCSFIYKTLVNVYGYADANIYVLMSDGTNPAIDISNGTNSNTDLDGDSDADIQGSATKANITSTFNTLSGILGQKDELFIFTTDHGGLDGSSVDPWDAVLYLWGETIKDDEFAVEVNKINAGMISIMMEQCNSGGFIDDLNAPNRIIATAARHDELSWAMPPTYQYDEFSFDWTAAVASMDAYGNPVNADSNSDGVVSMQEAFDYAEANDTQSETPQFSESPVDAGEQLTLNGTGDLYIKDQTPGDTGVEPNPFTGAYWISDDIWVRKDVDAGLTHENPEYKTSSPNGIYVRVRNRGCAPIKNAKLRVYFSKASTGLSWAYHWINFFDFTHVGYILHGDEITSVPLNLPDINPGQEYIAQVDWYPPNPADYDNDLHHFCLLARVESQIDPIGTETSSVYNNAKQFNNIAWKNISVYDLNPSNNITPTSVFIRNVNKFVTYTNLNFTTFDREQQITDFLKYGDVFLELDKDLYERWKSAGAGGKGIRVVGERTLQLVASNAVLYKIPLNELETRSITLSFKLREFPREKQAFVVDLLQFDAENPKEPVGGERFDIRYSPDKTDEKTISTYDLVLFPIPNNRIINLTIQSPTLDNTCQVEIFDLEKNLVAQFEDKHTDTNKYLITYDTKLKKGTYVCEISINGIKFSKKLIIE